MDISFYCLTCKRTFETDEFEWRKMRKRRSIYCIAQCPVCNRRTSKNLPVWERRRLRNEISAR